MTKRRIFCFDAVVILFASARCFSQGQIIFDNRVNNVVIAPVYGLEADPHLAKHGNTASGTPAGMQSYAGALLAGTAFTAQLLAGPTNASEAELKPLEPSVSFRTADASGFVVAPAFSLTVPNVDEGEPAQVRLRVWNNRSGTITNWQQVLEDMTIERGQSLSFISEPLGGIFVPPPNLNGLRSFNLALGEPPRLEIGVANSAPALVLFGSAGLHYDLQFRPSLDSQFGWQTLTNFILPTSPTTISDPLVSAAPTRFYRAVQTR